MIDPKPRTNQDSKMNLKKYRPNDFRRGDYSNIELKGGEFSR